MNPWWLLLLVPAGIAVGMVLGAVLGYWLLMALLKYPEPEDHDSEGGGG